MPVAWRSKKFTATQQRWHVTDKEAFGVIWGMNEFAPFLAGTTVTPVVETDHFNLLWMMLTATPRVQRWCIGMSGYPVPFRHIRGEDNVLE